MGGMDKGLQTFQGVALALHVLTRLHLGGGLSNVMINANRNLAAYESFGTPVWPDALPDYAGPLAGFLTGLERCETPYLVTVPCDAPLLPLDLVQRLALALEEHGAEIAMAAAREVQRDGQIQIHTQPVFCLLRVSLLESLVSFTRDGGRKVDAWTALHKTTTAPFDQAHDDIRAFCNVNTLDQLRELEVVRA